jgi:RNA polymerase sigma-70 factor (ECF subfamily)
LPKPDSNSDFSLVAAAKSGDREAFSALLQRHLAKVNAYLLAFVPQSEVDDLMQETMLAAWRGLPTLQQPDRLLPWLIGIARNLGRREYGRRQKQPQSLHEAAEVRAVGESAPAAEFTVERLMHHLQEMPEAYRISLAMRLIEGVGSEGIAEATGMTSASVRVNLSRGMKMLRARLKREGYP